MFKKLIEKHNQNMLEKQRKIEEQERNSPQFEISQLYAGEIVFCKEKIYMSNNIRTLRYYPVKKFAIFKKIGALQCQHIKSNQKQISRPQN